MNIFRPQLVYNNMNIIINEKISIEVNLKVKEFKN